MDEPIRWFYNIVQVSIVFISFLYGIIYWERIKQNGILKLFPIYIAVSLLTSLPWFFKQIRFPGVFIGNIFLVFEFYIFYNFFIKILKGRKFYFILKGLILLFFISAIIVTSFLYNSQTKYRDLFSLIYSRPLSELMFIENLFYIIPPLLYYISLFNRPYIQNVSTDSVFLTMSGILFCFSISTPLFAFIRVLDRSKDIFNYLYTINSVAYIIMHLFFIKAFKCIK